jgi:hypothetical protein
LNAVVLQVEAVSEERYMSSRLLLLLGLLAYEGVALAEAVEGTVQIKGSALKSTTFVSSVVSSGVSTGDKQHGTRICVSDTEQRIRHLTDLTVRVTGEWQATKSGEKDCLDASDYTVLKASSGREAVTGMLSRLGAGFVIDSADGRRLVLQEVPDGLKSLLGLNVVIDVKSIASRQATEATKVVVSYRPLP